MNNAPESKSPLHTSDFYFSLPESSIAKAPLAKRDQSRLMVLSKSKQSISHHVFHELPSLLPAGTTLVRNNSQVIPARILGHLPTGGKVELFYLERQSAHEALFLVQPARKFSMGKDMTMTTESGHLLNITVVKEGQAGERTLRISTGEEYHDILQLLEACGRTPLPPYMGKQEDTPELRARYQTVYAQTPGSVAAPTAGLHFTDRTFTALADRDRHPLDITLHVGAGTFLPVTATSITEHTMHKEWFQIEAPVLAQVEEAWKKQTPLLAVGTTSLRVLEHLRRTGIPKERDHGITGTTDIFIHPPHKVEGATMLLTNFHLPESTLIMLVSAFAEDRKWILSCYEEAVKEGYRFYSFGDAMLILP